jgi:hypothetical protein
MKRNLLLASTFAALPAIAQDRPNIILFLVDDMGVMDTSVPFLTDAEGQVQTHPLNNWYHTPNMIVWPSKVSDSPHFMHKASVHLHVPPL